MADQQVCKKLRKLLASQFRKAFGGDFEGMMAHRGQELWILGVDAKQKKLTDICGNVGQPNLSVINSKGFFDVDAGYKTDAHIDLNISNIKADVFILNSVYFSAPDDRIAPIIVHELAHMLEQSGVQPLPKYNDEYNAIEILKSLRSNVLSPNLRHNQDWALHLAIGARTILTKGHAKQKTIRAYLEAAIPSYDRKDGIKAQKGW